MKEYPYFVDITPLPIEPTAGKAGAVQLIRRYWFACVDDAHEFAEAATVLLTDAAVCVVAPSKPLEY